MGHRLSPSLSPDAYQRTTYLPGEVAQADWWYTGQQIPVGHGRTREAFGYLTTLPHSAGHAVVYSFHRTTAELLQAILGCLCRLGGVPEVLFIDNDSAAIASGKGRNAILHDEVAAVAGHLGLKIVVLEPARPESKGQVERAVEYLETSFLPLRRFESLADLQDQSDRWTALAILNPSRSHGVTSSTRTRGVPEKGNDSLDSPSPARHHRSPTSGPRSRGRPSAFRSRVRGR